ncbi:hypothetical protein ACFWM0_04540 [Streptomyces sp. NPDC058405]|uniref:hypothetical protein n=1 Tax=unclassified Streptomyces TaxID=2593676 RepID=UPI00364A36DE
MTSTADMTQHPDVSEISDLAEGLLSPSRTADVRSHLVGCVLCADVRDSLDEIRGLLGTLPGPPRMPADVAGRIDAALAAEALLDATAPDDAAAHVSRETTPSSQKPAAPALPPSDSTPADSTAADAVPADRPAGRPRAATGPGRSSHARRRRRNVVLGTVFGTAAVGVSVLLLQSLQSLQSSSDSSEASSGISATANDGKEFSEPRLQGRVDALLASGSASKGSKEPKTDRQGAPTDRGASNSPLFRPEPDVPPCVRQGTGRTDPVLAVEKGTYQGSDAYLVVLPDSADATRVEAYVIDGTCVDSAPLGKGKVLLTHSYTRH